MTTREEAAEALILNVQRAEELAANLSEADLATPIYGAEGPEWTVKDLFAHLASWGNQPAFFIDIVQRAMSSGDSSGPGFDINTFNKQQVDARRDRTIVELLAEFRQGHEEGCELIASLPDELVTFKMPHPFQGGMSTVLEMIQRSCLKHEAPHLMDIERVLGE